MEDVKRPWERLLVGLARSSRASICKTLGISSLFCLPIVFTACVSWPDIAYDCESYGVSENNQPMGNLVHIEPQNREQLDVSCQAAENATAKYNTHGETHFNGCAIPYRDGTVLAYYRVGDKCAKNHELCHAIHGTEHTERYKQQLESGVPMPYCPSNQLKLSGLARN